jgi:hypothetical protein
MDQDSSQESQESRQDMSPWDTLFPFQIEWIQAVMRRYGWAAWDTRDGEDWADWFGNR